MRQKGTRLGPYEILELLGTGGMGAVYRAFDPRLAREVAVKVLAVAASSDAGRLGRFEQEARAAGSLSHPNVVAVFDVGTDDGVPYVVTELLRGATLRDRMRGGPLPVRKAVDYGVQIARGLAAAHAKGIVHRDVKPENVFVSDDGHVKLLDFGLAKLLEVEHVPVTDSGSTASPTEPHIRVGTPGYMAPEQVQGLLVDARTDIFSLGAVLYEIVAGRRAFKGGTYEEIVASVLRDEPADLAALVPDVPPSLDRVVRRCLEKNPGERFHSAQDVAYALLATSEGPVYVVPDRPGPAGGRRGLAAVVMGATACVAALGAFAAWRGRTAGPAPTVIPFTALAGREIHGALSADGDHVAFAWDGEAGNFDVYHTLVGTDNRLRLTSDPANEHSPAWAADGRSVAFIRDAAESSYVLAVPALGGRPRRITNLRPWFGSGLSFSPDGRRIAFSDRGAPGDPFAIHLVTLDGERSRLTRPGTGQLGDAFPRFSPDGKSVAFARVSAARDLLTTSDLFVVPAGGGEPVRITPRSSFIGGLDWTPDGSRLVYTSGGKPLRLWSIPVTGGEPEPLPLTHEGVLSDGVGIVPSEVSGGLGVSLSRSGRRLVFTRTSWDTDIWRLPAGGGTPERFVSSTRQDDSPQYSPDGRRIAFTSARTGHPEIWLSDNDGTNPVRLTSMAGHSGTPRWSPDSRWIAFDSRPERQSDIHLIDAETGRSRRLTTDPAEDAVPSFSRDGQWVYFGSNRDGAWQIWKMPVAGGAARRVTTGGGLAAFESSDAREVFYAKPDAPGLWKVSASGGPERLVTESLRCWSYWWPTREGVYLLDRGERPGLRFLRLPDGPSQSIATLAGSANCADWGLALSPDGRWLLAVQAEERSDLMLAENFR
jgi:Tol biopolymer transport system component